jgi:hypothetical protein
MLHNHPVQAGPEAPRRVREKKIASITQLVTMTSTKKMNRVSRHGKDLNDRDQDTDLPTALQSKTTAKKSPVKRVAPVSERSPSPAKKARSASPSKAASAPTPTRARSKSPAKKTSPRKTCASAQPYKQPHPKQHGRGKIISPTNPQMIESLNKPNPFHETLPAPEIWHRRMPPYFPFGETPFMEREISRQIEEDLARGRYR